MEPNMVEYRELASGLLFPEGPIWMADGSVLLVEIARGTLSRVGPDGSVEVVAETGGAQTERPWGRTTASGSPTTAASAGARWAAGCCPVRRPTTTRAARSSVSTSPRARLKTSTARSTDISCAGPTTS